MLSLRDEGPQPPDLSGGATMSEMTDVERLTEALQDAFRRVEELEAREDQLTQRLAGADATIRVHEHTIRLVSTDRDRAIARALAMADEWVKEQGHAMDATSERNEAIARAERVVECIAVMVADVEHQRGEKGSTLPDSIREFKKRLARSV